MVSDEEKENISREEGNKSDEVEVEVELDPTDLDSQKIIEKEMGLIKVLDYITSSPFDLMFQKKLIEKYEKELIIPLIGGKEETDFLDGARLFLREESEKLDVKNKCTYVLKTAEKVAAENGIKSSFQKKIGRYSMALMALPMLGYFAAAYFWPESATYIMIPLVLLMCFGPNLIKKQLGKKWDQFKIEHTGTVIDIEKENIKQIKIFIQDLINDARDRLLTKGSKLEQIQFILNSDEFQNVQYVRTQGGTRGQPLSTVYQFQYPEGMGPQSSSDSYGNSGIPEDDANDSFILLKKSIFDEEGKLIEYDTDYADKDNEIPESLLSVSRFMTIEDPTLVIPTFNENSKLKCKCGEPIKLKNLKTCLSVLHSNYEFYLVIGEKCDCGENPFVLFTSPGNEKIPEGLKSLFE